MKATRLTRLFVAAVAASGLFGLGACDSTERRVDKYNVDFREPERRDYGAPKPAPKPAAAEMKEEPKVAAPAPTGCRPSVPAGWTHSSLAFPTGDERSSALLITQMMPGQVRAGAPYEYDIVVCNLTNGVLQNVVVKNEGMDNLNITSSNPAFAKGADGSIHWMVGELKAGESRTIKVTATAPKVGQASNCITASYANVLCVATRVVQPALAVTKTMDAEKLVCDTIAAKITVTNPGTGPAEGVKVVDRLPAGLTTMDGKSEWTWDVGTLAGGQSKSADITLKATKTGRYENSATATATGGLSAESNKVTVAVKQPVLTIKAECGGQALIGRNVVCKFTVKNTGDAAAANTVVRATVSPNTTFVSADSGGVHNGGTVVWNVGTLAPNESKTLSFTGRSTGAGQTTCSATAAATCAAEVRDQCTSSVIGVPDIGTLVDDADGVVTVGDPHTYRVEVANQGQVPLTNTKMVVTLPAGMEFVSSADGKLVGGKVEFNFGTLAPGARKTSTFVVKANKSGELLVIGETTCTEIKTPVRDDELTNFIDR